MKIFVFFAAVSAFAADASLLRFAGPGTQAVAGISVPSALNSPFGQFVMTQARPDNPEFQKFLDATGFDPRRDLQELLILSDAVGSKDRGLVVARGVFNGPQLMDFIVKSSGRGSLSTHSGVPLLSSGGRGNQAVAVLDGSIVLAGQRDLVMAAIDRRAAATTIDPRLAAKVAEVSGIYDIWGVTLSPALAAQVAGQKRLPADALKAVEQSSAGVKFGTTIRIAGEAVARSDKDAEALADIFRFVTGMVKLNDKQPSANPMASMLERLELRTNANLVQFSLAIPQAELEEMFKMRMSPPALH